MKGTLFDLYVETRLAPTLQGGDMIILENLLSHKGPIAAATMQSVGV